MTIDELIKKWENELVPMPNGTMEDKAIWFSITETIRAMLEDIKALQSSEVYVEIKKVFVENGILSFEEATDTCICGANVKTHQNYCSMCGKKIVWID